MARPGFGAVLNDQWSRMGLQALASQGFTKFNLGAPITYPSAALVRQMHGASMLERPELLRRYPQARPSTPHFPRRPSSLVLVSIRREQGKVQTMQRRGSRQTHVGKQPGRAQLRYQFFLLFLLRAWSFLPFSIGPGGRKRARGENCHNLGNLGGWCMGEWAS